MSKIYRGEMQDNLGNTIYPHTEAGLVYCSDGETVQEKLTGTAETLDGITGVSDSTELDDSTKLATSKAVNTLRSNVNSSLESNNEHFYYDVQNGVRGFNTDPARGADTFYPFNRINGEIVYRPSSSIEGYTLNASPNSYYLIQYMNYQGGRKFTFTGAEIIFTARSANYYSSFFSHTYIIKATSDNVNIVASNTMYGVVISKLT